MVFVGFDGRAAKPQESRPQRELLLRDTRIVAKCVSCESKVSASGNGYTRYIFIDENNRGWPYRVMTSGSLKTVGLGHAQHKQLCAAFGVDEIGDPREIYNIPVLLVMGVQNASGKWPAKNIIKYISNLGAKSSPKANGSNAPKDSSVDNKSPP